MNADMITLAAHAVAKDLQPLFNRRVRNLMRNHAIKQASASRPIQRVVNVRGVVPWPKRRR